MKNTVTGSERIDHPQDPRGDPGQPARPADQTRRRSSSSTCRSSTSARAPTASAPRPRPTSASRSASSRCRRRRLLAGLIPAPSRYSPRVDPAAAEAQAAARARRMLEEGMITEASTRRGLEPDGLAGRQRRRRRAPPRSCTRRRSQQSSRPVLHRLRAPVAGGAPARRAATRSTRAACASRRRSTPTLQAAAQRAGRRVPRRHRARPAHVAGLGRAADRLRARVRLRPRLRHRPGQLRRSADRWRRVGTPAGSSFKPFVLAEAFEPGHHPRHGVLGPAARRHRGVRPEPDGPVENYGGSGYGTLAAAQRHLELGEHRVHPPHPRRRRRQGRWTWRARMGLTQRARVRPGDPLRAVALGRRVGVAARHGLGLRRVRRPRAAGRAHARCCG